MQQINNFINEKLIINKNTKIQKYNYHPKDRGELIDILYIEENLIETRGNKADFNDIDVSEITDMSSLFDDSNFNGDISKWDVSNVTNMSYMFYNSEFTGENGDISNWDVSNVTNMRCMFEDSPLEKNPPSWYKK